MVVYWPVAGEGVEGLCHRPSSRFLLNFLLWKAHHRRSEAHLLISPLDVSFLFPLPFLVLPVLFSCNSCCVTYSLYGTVSRYPLTKEKTKQASRIRQAFVIVFLICFSQTALFLEGSG